MTMLSSSSPVAATSEVGRALDAGALEHEELGRVALDAPGARTPPRACRSGTARCSISVTSWPAAEQRPREVRADLAAACDQDVHLARRAPLVEARTASMSVSIALDVGQTMLQAARRVELARAPGRARGRRRVGTSNCFCATWPITRFVLSPSVVTTTASASSMPASRSSVEVHAVADEEPAGPVVAEPPERVLVLVDDGHVPARAAQLAARRPSRPGRSRSTIAFTAAQRSSARVQPLRSPRAPRRAPLREGDDQHLARRLAQHVVDRRREEARLAAPARRRAEHDQVGVDLARALDDRVADRAGAHGRRLDRRRRARRRGASPRRATPRRAPPRRTSARRAAARAARGSRAAPRTSASCSRRELDRGREHLLADHPELHRHEDPLRTCGTARRGCSSRRVDPLHQPLAVRAADGDEDDEPDARARPGRRSARPGASPSRRPRPRTSATAPTIAGQRDLARRGSLTLNGARYGRGRSGSSIRSLITASCAAVNASRTPNEKRLARNATSSLDERRRDHDRRRDRRGRDDRLRRDERAPVQPAERARQLAVLAERVGEPREAGDRRRHRREQDQRAGDADVEAQHVAEPVRQLARRCSVATPSERRAQPRRRRARSAGPGNAESATTAIAT